MPRDRSVKKRQFPWWTIAVPLVWPLLLMFGLGCVGWKAFVAIETYINSGPDKT